MNDMPNSVTVGHNLKKKLLINLKKENCFIYLLPHSATINPLLVLWDLVRTKVQSRFQTHYLKKNRYII